MLAEKELQINKGQAAQEAARVQSTLAFSILDGMGYSVMVGAGETYFIPYAIFLGGGHLLFWQVVALPLFIWALGPIFFPRLLFQRWGPKRSICAGALFLCLLVLPVL